VDPGPNAFLAHQALAATLFLSASPPRTQTDLDIRGVTPKMLKNLVSRISGRPFAIYYLLMEVRERRKVEFNAEILGITAWHVREGYRRSFRRRLRKKR
jgi:hypothetical protein